MDEVAKSTKIEILVHYQNYMFSPSLRKFPGYGFNNKLEKHLIKRLNR